MKLLYKRQKLWLLTITVLASSCKIMYTPTTIRPNMLQQKGDFHVGFNGFAMGEIYGGYAVTNHFGVAASVSGANEKTNHDDSYTDTNNNIVTTNEKKLVKRRDIEFSGGYFTQISESSTFEVFGGYGKFHSTDYFTFTDNAYPDRSQSYKINSLSYNRIFIQPAVGYRSNHFDLYYANRLSNISYGSRHNDFISENSVVARFGFSRVKFMAQLGLTIALNQHYEEYLPITCGFGISYCFSSNQY